MILEFIINGLITGILYSLMAIGFTLVYNTTKVFHIAAAALFAFAAYMFYWAANSLGWPVVVAAAFAITLTMVLSLVTDLAIYRPLKKRKASGNVAMVASIGLMTIIVHLLVLAFGSKTKKFNNSTLPSYSVGSLVITTPQLAQLIIGSVAIVLFLLFIGRSSWGIRFRALSTDSTLYETLGYSTPGTRMLVFLLSGAFIALGGCLTAYDTGMNPDVGMNLLISAMVAMIVGGVGRFGTCVSGGLILGVLQAVTVYHLSDNWKNAVAFIVLLLFLFLRPQGLAGIKMRTV